MILCIQIVLKRLRYWWSWLFVLVCFVFNLVCRSTFCVQCRINCRWIKMMKEINFPKTPPVSGCGYNIRICTTKKKNYIRTLPDASRDIPYIHILSNIPVRDYYFRILNIYVRADEWWWDYWQTKNKQFHGEHKNRIRALFGTVKLIYMIQLMFPSLFLPSYRI